MRARSAALLFLTASQSALAFVEGPSGASVIDRISKPGTPLTHRARSIGRISGATVKAR